MKLSLNYLFICIISLAAACTSKSRVLTVKFEGAVSEKKWALNELKPELASDWSSSGFLTFEFNSTTTQRFELNLYDQTGVRTLMIHPFQGVWVRASIPLIHFQKMNTEGMDQAAIWKTPRPGYWIGFTREVGPLRNIDSIGVRMSLPIGSPTLEIRNFRLTQSPEDTVYNAKPLVDEFGQWIPADWPGKSRSINDLISAWREEEKSLQDESLSSSTYGAFTGTKAEATGFFHTEKINNIWWFIDPEGQFFFSNGSNCIGSGSDFSRIRDREYLFSAMPPASELGIKDNPDRRDDNAAYYTWNLFRRFGPGWYQKWMELTFKRMDNWGINTVGNWSDPALGEARRKTYVATLDGWGIETGIMGMPDVYAADYALKTDRAASEQCSPKKEDPFLLGYFIGNEPAWPGRETEFTDVVLSGGETPMQAELKKFLAGGDTPDRRKTFVYETYSRFLNIVCSAIKKYDHNHLNLGLRFGNPPSDEIIIESKKYFNVFSFNHYGYSVNHSEIQNIYEKTGLPVIIGEFHFGTPGRGLAPGLAQTKNPEERGVAFQFYVENAAAHPAVIGTHWFQWIDQPPTGRYDGENYNIGLLDVTDRPYPDMISAVKVTFNRLHDVHAGTTVPVTRQAILQ